MILVKILGSFSNWTCDFQDQWKNIEPCIVKNDSISSVSHWYTYIHICKM